MFSILFLSFIYKCGIINPHFKTGLSRIFLRSQKNDFTVAMKCSLLDQYLDFETDIRNFMTALAPEKKVSGHNKFFNPFDTKFLCMFLTCRRQISNLQTLEAMYYAAKTNEY